jgi:hypothetical protein
VSGRLQGGDDLAQVRQLPLGLLPHNVVLGVGDILFRVLDLLCERSASISSTGIACSASTVSASGRTSAKPPRTNTSCLRVPSDIPTERPPV